VLRFFFFFRKTQIEGKAAKLVEAKSHCLYYENYEATQTAKCCGLDEAAREIAATLEVSGDFLKARRSLILNRGFVGTAEESSGGQQKHDNPQKSRHSKRALELG